ncbi:MAG: ParB/RepB/Spo0J family partition protein [Patescibacteria group bacterium]|nr:ParB/RepB/Spo0J family partition protein [Patescibacteria group bacterium]
MAGRGLESLIPKKNHHKTLDDKSGILVAPPASTKKEPIYHTRTAPSTSHIGKSYPFPYQGRSIHREPPPYEKDFRATEEIVYHPHSKKEQIHSESIFHIEVDKIKSNPYQPRKEFNEESLEELAQSIREFGILQPLVVSKVVKETEHGTDVIYQLIAGERRLKAAEKIGLERVPAIIKKIDLEKSRLEMALIENLQRSNLSSIELAQGYARLQDEFGMTQREISGRVGKSRESVANTLRLLNLPTKIQDALNEGKINDSQARMLVSIIDFDEQQRIFEGLLEKKTTVRELQNKISEPGIVSPEQNYWERQLEEKLGAPVKVAKHGKRGKITIQFYSEEEWQSILDKILGEENLNS